MNIENTRAERLAELSNHLVPSGGMGMPVIVSDEATEFIDAEETHCEKDISCNVRAAIEGGTRESVANVADDHYRDAIAMLGAALPYGQSEFEHAGLTPARSKTARASRVLEARAGFECKKLQTLRVGRAPPVVGTVPHAWIQVGVADERRRVGGKTLQPFVRLVGQQYCRATDDFKIVQANSIAGSDEPVPNS